MSLPFSQRYDLLEPVGQGGMGVVYRAVDKETGRRVAIKQLLDTRSSDRVVRFQREASILAELEHPAIVKFFDFGVTEEGAQYLAMEWLEGIDLAQRLDESLLSVSDAARLGRLVAEALGAAHAAGVVHRDLKPPNLFLVGGSVERVKIIDFGIAALEGGLSQLTGTGLALGTPEYMAPEQARGERPLGPRVDLHALGTILFECITGTTPFTGATPALVVAALLFSDAPRLRLHAPHVPPVFEELVARLLSKDPSARPASAAEVVAALLAIEHSGSLPPNAVRPAVSGDEQRTVTVVAARDPGAVARADEATVDIAVRDAASSPRASASVSTVPAVALEHGAELRLVKGSGAVLVFTQPVPTDAARAAARAALVLARRHPELRLAVVSGTIRSKTGLGSAFLDGAFQLAAEAGEVFVSPLTKELLAGAMELEVRGEGVVLKGERREEQAPPKLYGRERELGAVLGALEGAVADASAQAVLLVGPVGIGKSRLVQEAVQRFERLKARPLVLRARGEEVRKHTPFAALSTMLRRTLGVSAAADEATQIASLRSATIGWLGEEAGRRAADLFAAAMALTLPDPAEDVAVALLDPVLFEDALEASLSDLFAGLAARAGALAVVLDDAHWADASSLKLLLRVKRRMSELPLFVLFAARPEIDEQLPHAVRDAIDQRLQLGGLSKRAAAELAESLRGGSEVDDLAEIVARADGNPLFLQQLVDARTSGGSGELPATVLASVEARLLRLEPSARKILRAASVFGEVFWDGGVAALLGPSAAESPRLGEWLVHLVTAGFLSPHRTTRFAGHAELGFVHPLLREAAYAMLPPSDRVDAHRLAAAWLEEVGERDPITFARHFDAANDKERSAKAYLSAAQRSFERNDMEHAVTQAERAAELGVEGERRPRLDLLLAEAYMWTDKLDLAEVAARAAVTALERGTQAWVEALSVLGGILARSGSDDVPFLISELCGAVRASSEVFPRPSALPNLVSAALRAGSPAMAREVIHVLAPAVLQRSGHPYARLFVLMCRSWEATYEGDFATAVACDRETLELALAAADTRQAILARIYVGNDYLMLGAYELAEAELVRAEQEAKRAKLEAMTMAARHNLGLAVHRKGEPERGLALQRDYLAFGLRTKNALCVQQARRYLAIQLAELGRDNEAEQELGELIGPNSPTWARADAFARKAVFAQRRGDLPAARKLAETALKLFESLRLTEEGEATIRLFVAEVLLATGDPARGRALLEKAAERIERLAAKIEDATLREAFLTRVPEHRRTLELWSAQR